MSDSYYTSVYHKRLNRYGNDYQSRIEGKRAREFEDFLLKTPNRIDFEFNGTLVAAALEQFKEDYSETRGYLLTTKDTDLPNGTVISFNNKRGEEDHWMVWWLEQIKTSGYNRYVILKMSHYLEWTDDNGSHGQWGSLQGTGTDTIRDSVVAGKSGARFGENNNTYMFITPYNNSFERDFYMETQNGEKLSAFQIVEFDNQSTKGISYLSVDPVAVRDKTPIPEKKPTDNSEDFFWLNGGK